MGLSTDSLFITALQSNSDLMEALGCDAQTGAPARLYGTAIPLPDEDVDNVPVSYVIVTFDGLNNDAGTKDDRYESDYDKVNIGIEVCGETLKDLHDITKLVRGTIRDYFRENETAIDDYIFGAQAIQFDSMKPCYWQVLTYQCDVKIINEDDDEQD